jgi:type I restriction enzyme S subunit
LEEKQRLTRQGVIKKTPTLDAITSEECPFVVPENWAWAHLNDFGDWGSGSTPNRGSHEFYGGTIPWLKSGELNDGTVTESEETVTELALENCSLRINKPGDVLFAMYGATVGKVAILGVEATSNQAVCACTCFSGVFNRYLFFLLRAFKQQFIRESAGAAQPNFSKDKIIRSIAPLPPLAEQHRIVAKVEELLALCDELESRQATAREHRTRLVHSALDHLTAAKDYPDFQNRAHFILHHSPFILEDVPALRQAILSLAVQARISPDGLRGEAGSVPASWRSVTLREVAEHRLGKMLDHQKNRGTPRRYLRNTNVHWFRFDLSSIKELPIEDHELQDYELRRGDVLICEGGHGIGRTAVWESDEPGIIFQKALHRVRPGKHLEGYFLAFCMKVYADTGVLQQHFTGAGIPHLTGQSLARIRFPLPPLAAQKRIVAQVEELMRWCDQLETHLAAARTTGEKLMDTALAKITSACL